MGRISPVPNHSFHTYRFPYTEGFFRAAFPVFSHVPYIEYHGYDEDKCKILQELAKNVLLLSKEENDSNEVAITCDLGIENPLEQFGIALGTEHEVDILADTFLSL